MARTKKTKKAPAETVTLYKVTTADGHSPYITAYAWSLPREEPPGSGNWLPGEWHEEPERALNEGRGLHVTPTPTRYRPGGRSNVVYVCEAAGHRVDPATDSHVVALRVRLLRPATWDEAEDASYRWEAELRARREHEDMCERLDRARSAAKAKSLTRSAARKRGVKSPALTAFELLVEMTPTASWNDVNEARRDALQYAVDHLEFDPGDVADIAARYAGHRWMGDGEGLYGRAAAGGNRSACVSLERHMGRKPWWTVTRDGRRERLTLGSRFWWEETWVKITSFRDDEDALVACAYEDQWAEGRYPGEGRRHVGEKIVRRFTIARAGYDAARRASAAKGCREAA